MGGKCVSVWRRRVKVGKEVEYQDVWCGEEEKEKEDVVGGYFGEGEQMRVEEGWKEI